MDSNAAAPIGCRSCGTENGYKTVTNSYKKLRIYDVFVTICYNKVVDKGKTFL